MPKATLSFSLPEEQEEFKWANNGLAYLTALQDIAQTFRDKAKYSEGTIEWEDAKQLFWDTLNAAGVEIS